MLKKRYWRIYILITDFITCKQYQSIIALGSSGQLVRNTCTVEGAKLRSRRLAPTKTLLAASRFDWKTERQTRRLCLTDVNPMNVSCKHKEYDACFQAGRHRHWIGLRNANKINPSTNIWCVIESGNVRRLFFVSTFDCFSFYSCLFGKTSKPKPHRMVFNSALFFRSQTCSKILNT